MSTLSGHSRLRALHCRHQIHDLVQTLVAQGDPGIGLREPFDEGGGAATGRVSSSRVAM
jgi:hypothetical protein